MSAKPPRTHILDPRPDAHAAGIDGMLCGMQSRPERPLVFSRDPSLADCSKCVARSKESSAQENRGFLNRVATVNKAISGSVAAGDRLVELERRLDEIK